MRKGKPSGTSTMVAFWRALSTAGVTRVRDFSDPFAVQLLPPWPSRALRALGWWFKRHPEFKERVLTESRGMMDVVALRSRAIDVDWAEAARDGVRQLVILGAGLDARAYRLPGLEGVSVFEVDHPATQAFKQARARDLRSPAASLTYVPVDFARDDLGHSLRAAGLRTAERSFWVWEGVTHYLPHEATASTIAAIASLAAEGSRLVTTYGEPNPALARMRTRRLMLRWAGEPQIGLLERAHMARLLERAGWRVLADEGIAELSQQFGDGRASETGGIGERVVLAERARAVGAPA